MKTSTIGIVTVTYNSADVIDDFMASTLAQTHREFFLYVVDNASTDDTLTRVACYDDPRIVVITLESNAGFAAASNRGVVAATKAGCGSVLLINNDTTFNPPLLKTLLVGMERQQCDMVAPKMYYHDRPDVFWWAGGDFVPWHACAGRHRGMGETDRGQYERACRVAFAPMCCMLIRTSVFERIGGLDEKYFVYYEDADFCFRAMRAGLTLDYLPQAALWHKVSSLTGGSHSAFTVQNIVCNRVYFIRKNLKWFSQPYSLLYCQARYWQRLLTRQDNCDQFRLRQQAFRRGLALARSRGGGRQLS